MLPRSTFILLGLVGFGCASLAPAWEAFPGKTPDEVWGAAQDVVNGEFDLDVLDTARRTLETAWREELSHSSRVGRRLRVVAWVEWDAHRGAPLLCVEVDKQINTNMDRPISSASARWSPDGRDSRLERLVLDRVKIELMEIRPSSEIREGTPSKYRRDPRDEGRKNLWGGNGPEDPSGDPDLWKRDR